MSNMIAARIAKLENGRISGGPRSFVVSGGRADGVAGFLGSFGVGLSRSDKVDHIAADGQGTGAGEMKLVGCDDMSVILAYVAEHGKSLVSTLSDQNGRY